MTIPNGARYPLRYLDVEAGILQLGDVAAYGAFAHADLVADLGHPAAELVTAEHVQNAQRTCDLAEITAPIHRNARYMPSRR
ncbi:MAG TPA: hypothetical protein VMJ10_08215 [Kofleriaceae bacterium]|nr:hypothetical protein [Kofleriaceae bacterium]